MGNPLHRTAFAAPNCNSPRPMSNTAHDPPPPAARRAPRPARRACPRPDRQFRCLPRQRPRRSPPRRHRACYAGPRLRRGAAEPEGAGTRPSPARIHPDLGAVPRPAGHRQAHPGRPCRLAAQPRCCSSACSNGTAWNRPSSSASGASNPASAPTTGDFHVVEALATLAWDSRRAKFFRSELIAALRILNSGDVTPARMTGSYAGAMGQPQFMPSSYLRYAVDFEGNGRRDIWTSTPDTWLPSPTTSPRAAGAPAKPGASRRPSRRASTPPRPAATTSARSPIGCAWACARWPAPAAAACPGPTARRRAAAGRRGRRGIPRLSPTSPRSAATTRRITMPSWSGSSVTTSWRDPPGRPALCAAAGGVRAPRAARPDAALCARRAIPGGRRLALSAGAVRRGADRAGNRLSPTATRRSPPMARYSIRPRWPPRTRPCNCRRSPG